MSTLRLTRLTILTLSVLALSFLGCKDKADTPAEAPSAEATAETPTPATPAADDDGIKRPSNMDLAYTADEAKAFEADATREITPENATEKAAALLSELEGQLKAEGLEMPQPRKAPARKGAPPRGAPATP